MRPDMDLWLDDEAEKVPETLQFTCPRCGYTIVVATDRTPWDKDITIDPQRRAVGIPLGWTVETTGLNPYGVLTTDRRYGDGYI